MQSTPSMSSDQPQCAVQPGLLDGGRAHALLAVPGQVARATVQPSGYVDHLKSEPECFLLQGEDPRIGKVSKNDLELRRPSKRR